MINDPINSLKTKDPRVTTPDVEKSAEANKYIAKTYIWLFVGLIETFAIGFISDKLNLFHELIVDAPEVALIFLVAYVILGIAMTAGIRKMPYVIALVLYFIFNAAQGFALGVTLRAYDLGSVMYVFVITAVLFGLMGLWGMTTKRDLSHWGSALFFAMIGLIAMSLLGIFIHMTIYEYIISFAGIIIFVLNTAYDTQRIKTYFVSQEVYHQGDEQELEALNKGTVVGAFSLLLNFLNIFLRLLTLLGKQRR